jgi:type I restriction enzyme M protein
MTMLSPADNPELVKSLLHLSNRLRDRGIGVETIASLLPEVSAALCLVRNACGSGNDAFRHAASLHWDRIQSLPPNEVSSYVKSAVFSWLKTNEIPKDCEFLKLIVQVNSLLHADPEFFDFARDRVALCDFSSKDDRLRLASEFDGYIEFASSKFPQLGQFVTPRPLIDLMITLAKPVPGDVIYDPFCGMGGLLASAANVLSSVGAELEDATQFMTQICGKDLLPGLALVALARTILSGNTTPIILVGDTLEVAKQDISAAGATCVISNPPFGSRREQQVKGALGIPSRSIDVLAMQHIVASLAPGGRALVVVPESFLFGSGSVLRLRQLLLTDYCVEAVIAIPRSTIHKHTSIKTNLIVVTKRPPRQNVLFISDEFTRRMLSDGPSGVRRVSMLNSLLSIRRTGLSIPSCFYDNFMEFQTELSAGRTINSPERNARLLSEAADLLQIAALLPTDDRKRLEVIDRCRKEFDPTETFNLAVWETSIDQLKQRSYELVIKPPTENELGSLLEQLATLAPDSQLRTLSEVAEVFSGFRYKMEFLTDSANHPQSVPLVRVQDITLGAKKASSLPEPAKPRKYLLPLAVESIKDHIRLRRGDILLTASGTVGAIGIAGASVEGTVPSNGIIVIRARDYVDRIYLLRLLQSMPYQSWFAGRSSGSTIRHLSLQQVRGLPVVLLPKSSSERITNFLAGGEDATTILRVISDLAHRSAPIHQLNERLVRELTIPVDWHTPDSEKWWSQLSHWLDETHSCDPTESDDPYLDWIRTLAKELIEAKSLPDATDRYALFQSWQSKLAQSSTVPTKAISSAQLTLWSTFFRQYADQLARSFFEACTAQTAALLEDINLDSTASPSVVSVGVTSEIQVTVRNKGALPLRKVQFLVSPMSSLSNVSWLKPGESHAWTLHLTPTSPGRQSIYISWTGERMDGSLTDGRLEIAIQANKDTPESLQSIFSQNPYICGAPIDSTEMFYGRTEIINKIRRSLRHSGPSTVIILEGNRRAGKTSICKQLLLTEPNLLPRWIRAYWSLQAAPGHASLPGLPTREIYYNIARELYLACFSAQVSVEIIGLGEQLEPTASRIHVRRQLERLHPLFTDDNAFRLIDSQIEDACNAIGDRRILLILDEFEKLQEGIDNGITSPQLPENIRDLFQRYNKLSGILTGSKRIKRLREEYWSILYGIGIRINVGALDEAATRDLIQSPTEGKLVFSPSATDKIISLCACQPFLIQSLCHYVFEECATAGTQSVTTGTVDAAVSQLLDENEHFATLWYSISTDRRRYLAYLVVILSDGPDVITSSFLAQRFEADGINPAALDDDIGELRELDVLGMRPFNQNNSYYIGIPLFALWMRKHKDFSICRDRAISE